MPHTGSKQNHPKRGRGIITLCFISLSLKSSTIRHDAGLSARLYTVLAGISRASICSSSTCNTRARSHRPGIPGHIGCRMSTGSDRVVLFKSTDALAYVCTYAGLVSTCHLKSKPCIGTNVHRCATCSSTTVVCCVYSTYIHRRRDAKQDPAMPAGRSGSGRAVHAWASRRLLEDR